MASTLVFANNAGSTLSGSISNTAISLNLQAGGGALFPNPTGSQYFVVTAIDAATGLLREIMWCTARSADTLTVVRAQEGTTALAWNAGDLIQELWTAGQAADMLQLGQAGILFVPVIPQTTWYVDGGNGTDAPGQGLSSGAGAFATPAYAVSQISTYFSSSLVTINVANWATKYAGFGISSSLISSWSIIGGGTSTCTIAASSTATNGGVAFQANSATVEMTGFTLEGISYCLWGNLASNLSYTNLKLMGDGSSANAVFSGSGSTVFNNNSSTITYAGSFAGIFVALSGGLNQIGFNGLGKTRTIALTNSSATISAGFAIANQGGTVSFAPAEVSFAGGNPTGPRYSSTGTGQISVGGSGSVTYLPGTTAGTAQNTFNYGA